MHVLRQRPHLHLKVGAFILGACLAAAIFSLSGWLFLQNSYQNRYFEGVFIDNVNISGLTQQEAVEKLGQNPSLLAAQTVTLTSENLSIASSAAELGLHKDYQSALTQAYHFGRNQDLNQNLQEIFQAYTKGRNFSAQLAFDSIKVQEFVTQLAAQVNQSGETPYAQLKNGVVEIYPGKLGKSLLIDETTQKVLAGANDPVLSFIVSPALTGTELTQEQSAAAKIRAEKFIGKTVEGKYDTKTVQINDSTLIEALALPTGYNEEKVEKIVAQFKEKIDRPAQNAEFVYDSQTLNVSKFTPDLDGLTVDTDETKKSLATVLQQIEQGSAEKLITLTIPAEAKKADVTLASLNNLGLKERVAFGESYYAHSIPTRIHNVSQASKIINNTIVKPGEEFSFNKALGEVSKETGFQPAYVIKGGQTVLGDGGGVCQVSTTLFRALLDGGMNITKRKAHSYRVSYYELNKDPGFDATVYAGDVDLRFVNDTPGHLLIHFETFPNQLYMFVTIYGTSDGRKSEITEYKKWDARPAAPTQYIDDPTLPPGKLVQIDYAVAGIKASFKYTVKDKDGNVKYENTYYSNYVPWSAKYRRGI